VDEPFAVGKFYRERHFVDFCLKKVPGKNRLILKNTKIRISILAAFQLKCYFIDYSILIIIIKYN